MAQGWEKIMLKSSVHLLFPLSLEVGRTSLQKNCSVELSWLIKSLLTFTWNFVYLIKYKVWSIKYHWIRLARVTQRRNPVNAYWWSRMFWVSSFNNDVIFQDFYDSGLVCIYTYEYLYLLINNIDILDKRYTISK